MQRQQVPGQEPVWLQQVLVLMQGQTQEPVQRRQVPVQMQRRPQDPEQAQQLAQGLR